MAELILALDVPSAAEALTLVDRLPGLRWVKVGSVLMTNAGPPLIRDLAARGYQVFLDLKWHDIPNTVRGAVTAARDLGVQMATVHTLGGAAMLDAAVRAAGPDLGVVGVTVLTSHDSQTYGAAIGRDRVDLGCESVRLAKIAVAAGLRGVVCSPWEAESIRTAIGRESWLVVPGIRRAGDTSGDQIRTASPAEAVERGATHLVVGRPVLSAADPPAEFLAVQRELA